MEKYKNQLIQVGNFIIDKIQMLFCSKADKISQEFSYHKRICSHLCQERI